VKGDKVNVSLEIIYLWLQQKRKHFSDKKNFGLNKRKQMWDLERRRLFTE